MTLSCRLYLITPPAVPDAAAFARAFEAALEGGDVACLQVRLKGEGAHDAAVVDLAKRLLPIARKHDVALLINDRPDLAQQAGADGVHVGQSDASCREARRILGDDATVGVTCHDSRHLALEAGEAGADYVAFGAFFPTTTKDAATRANPSILEWWTHATTLPSVAIGGITPDNCAPLIAAGADFLAVSGAVWGHKDGPGAAVAQFRAAIDASAPAAEQG